MRTLYQLTRLNWQRGLRGGSAPPRLLRIAGSVSVPSVVYCHVEVSA